MKFRVTSIRFKDIPVNSTVVAYKTVGTEKRVSTVFEYVGTGQPTQSSIKVGEIGSLEVEFETPDDGGGSRVISGMEFFRKNDSGQFEFFVTKDSSTTYCV